MAEELYDRCRLCNPPKGEPARYPREDCPGCRGRGYGRVGLTMAQVDRYVFEAHHWYHADGSAERLASADEVKARRVAAAKELGWLRAEASRLEAERDDLRAEVERLRAELARRGRDDVPRIRSDWRVPPFGAEEREIAGEV